MEKEILTICLPTYNRSSYIEKQLLFFEKILLEHPELSKKIKFIVSNNASSDNTKQILLSMHQRNPFFNVNTNLENLGLVGNILKCLQLATTEYVWFVSDDDILSPDILNQIIKILTDKNSPEFIFLNYKILKRLGFSGTSGLRLDGKKAATEIFREGYGSLVFMTACVYRTATLKEIADEPASQLLSGPMFFSFYSCAKGPIYITSDALITFNPSNASYAGTKRVLKLKFVEYIDILQNLPRIGYDEKQIQSLIKDFFSVQSHAHLLFFLVSPNKAFSQLKYHSKKSIFRLPLNCVSYASNIISSKFS